MNRDVATTAIRLTLHLLRQIALSTRTPADDLMASILQANQAKLTDALTTLLDQSEQPPTDQQVKDALARVGIKT